MSTALLLLPKLAPVLARHIAAYAELTASDVTGAARFLARRLVAGAVAVIAAFFALAIACTWIVAASWNTPWRTPVMGTLLSLFAAIAVGCAWWVTRRSAAGASPFCDLRAEWDRDQALLDDLSESRVGSGVIGAPPSVAVSPSATLQQTRQELRDLLGAAPPPGGGESFPRSSTMRFLVNGGGKQAVGALTSAAVLSLAPSAARLLTLLPLSSLMKLIYRRRAKPAHS